MVRFSDVDVFLAVVEAGSFRGAVSKLGVSRSTVSRAIQRLEEHLSAALILRDTQSIRLTDAGTAYYRHARIAADALVAGERAAAATSDAVAGPIHLSAPSALGPGVIAPICARFLADHPAASLSLNLTDKLVNPIQDGIDLAVRTGERLEDSDLRARKLTGSPLVAVASPAVASGLASAAEVPLVRFRHPNRDPALSPPRATRIRLEVDDYLALREALLLGVGVGVIGEVLVAGALRDGTLVRVLPQWSLPEARFWAVFPADPPMKVRALIDALIAGFRAL